MTYGRPDTVTFLTGNASGRVRPGGIGPVEGGEKFLEDGTVQHWAGNTFLCHVPEGAQKDAMRAMQDEMKDSDFGRFYTFLPPSSFHMTVFQGVSPRHGKFEELPKGADGLTDRDAVTAHMAGQVRGLKLPQRQRVRMASFYAGLGLTMQGADESAEISLRATRTRLKEATGISHAADFETYVFHVTFAYLLEWLSDETALEVAEFCSDLTDRFKNDFGTLELGPIEFCNFDSMHHFEPVIRL